MVLYSGQFILAKAQLFSLSFLYIEDEQPPPRTTPLGAYRSATSYGIGPPSICLHSHTFYSFHILTHSYLVGRSMVVGHIPMVHTFFNVHQSHRSDSTHPSLFYRVGYHSYIYMEHSTAGYIHISHFWSNASRKVTHPCINWAHDCLTSVIKRKTFVPCHVSPFIIASVG